MDPSVFMLASFQQDVHDQPAEAAAEARADAHPLLLSASDASIAAPSPALAADVLNTRHDTSDVFVPRMDVRDDVTLAFTAAISIEPSTTVSSSPVEAPLARSSARPLPILSLASSEVCIWLRDPAVEAEVDASPSPASVLGSAHNEASDNSSARSVISSHSHSSHHSAKETVLEEGLGDAVSDDLFASSLSQPVEPALPQTSEYHQSFDSVHRQMMDDVTNLSMRQRVLSDPIKQLGYGIEARFGFTLRQLHVPGRLGTEDFMLASELTEDPAFVSLCAAAIDATLPPTIFT